MSDYKIYALKTDSEENEYWKPKLYESLKSGKARFGWSFSDDCNLIPIKDKIENLSWDALNEDEKGAWNANFLLYIEVGDYLVYINLPEYGKCSVAQVETKYFWDKWDSDFNHCIGIKYIGTFDRNEKGIHPYLQRRLKLQGKYWTINAQSEFEDFLDKLKSDKLDGQPQLEKDRIKLLENNAEEHYRKIAHEIYKTHPEKKLEELVAEILKHMPRVTNVVPQRGSADLGADIVFEMETDFNINNIKCIAQVKSYDGTIDDVRAINDIRRAFDVYKEAKIGLIITTAIDKGKKFDEELDKLIMDTGKDVGVILGNDLVKLFMKYGT